MITDTDPVPPTGSGHRAGPRLQHRNAADADFDSADGCGAELSMRLRNEATGVSIEPCLQYTAPADSDETTVGSTEIQIRDANRALGGVRLGVAF